MKDVLAAFSFLCFSQSYAASSLELTVIKNIKFTNELCDEAKLKCTADVQSLKTGEFRHQKFETSIFLFNIINAYRSTGVGGDIFVLGNKVLAASSLSFPQQIVFADQTTLVEAHFSVLGPEASANQLVEAKVVRTENSNSYLLTYTHLGDGRTHQVCQEDPVSCVDYVDRSFTDSVTLPINPALDKATQRSSAGTKFFVLAAKEIKAVLTADGTLTLAK